MLSDYGLCTEEEDEEEEKKLRGMIDDG